MSASPGSADLEVGAPSSLLGSDPPITGAIAIAPGGSSAPAPVLATGVGRDANTTGGVLAFPLPESFRSRMGTHVDQELWGFLYSDFRGCIHAAERRILARLQTIANDQEELSLEASRERMQLVSLLKRVSQLELRRASADAPPATASELTHGASRGEWPARHLPTTYPPAPPPPQSPAGTAAVTPPQRRGAAAPRPQTTQEPAVAGSHGAIMPTFEDFMRAAAPMHPTNPHMPADMSWVSQLARPGDPFPHPAGNQAVPPALGEPSITVSATPDPLPPDHLAVQLSQPRGLGAYCPGLQPMTTMLQAFSMVVEYRTYRLSNTRSEILPYESGLLHRLKKQIDGAHPTLGQYDGTEPIQLLSFLHKFVEAVNAMSVAEAAAVRLLSYFLVGSAKDTYSEQASPGTTARDAPLRASWPFVVHALLARFLSDDVLQDAHERVTLARQDEGEDEIVFAERISRASRDCCHVFSRHELVNFFVRGLRTEIRDDVQDRVRHLPVAQRGDLSVVRQTAAAVGRSLRHLAGVKQASPAKKQTPARQPALLLHKEEGHDSHHTPPSFPPQQWGMPGTDGFHPAPTPNWELPTARRAATPYSAFVRTPAPTPHRHRAAQEVVRELEPILFTGKGREGGESSPSSAGDLEELLQSYRSDARPIDRAQTAAPRLSEDQLRFAMQAIPEDYWQLNCWSCRDSGHSTFTCPYLTAVQRVWFAYCYYAWMVDTSPHMADQLADREAGPQRRSTRGGTRPRFDRGSNRGRGRGGPRPVRWWDDVRPSPQHNQVLATPEGTEASVPSILRRQLPVEEEEVDNIELDDSVNEDDSCRPILEENSEGL